MSKLDTAPDVISVAVALKLNPRLGAVQEIVRYCHERIAGFISEFGQVTSLEQLQEVVCRGLHLVFEEIRSDYALNAVTKKYVAMGEGAFGSLAMQLDGDTFATLMEREHAKAGARDRYVAVIDCRGPKGARRFFTKWHEIAHLLTLVKQLELPFHRSTATSEDPLEKLMDHVAGEVGFYGPLFEPALAAEIEATGVLTFDGVERVRQSVFPDASYQATLYACIKRMTTPVLLIEVGMGYKKAEEAALRSRQMSMFEMKKPEAKLRVLSVSQNAAARDEGFTVRKNMQVPGDSIAARAFNRSDEVIVFDDAGEEEFSIWRHSNGEAVAEGTIRVEARQIGGTRYALIQRP